ncbi:MADS-box transcription factor 2-like [Aristolochia californica]|uniref:MADS-box transcription factor 2-like n=1 Tax=Aristolochia californica TaxID=171875 RepID=UPI0035DFF79E
MLKRHGNGRVKFRVPHPASVVRMEKKATNMGKRKIEIKKIENLSNRQVTFSKRRQGLFKKATDFLIRCGIESGIAVVVFSPAGKPFVLAEPPGSLDDLMDRYLQDEGGIWIWDEERLNAERDVGELESLVTGLEELKGIVSRFADGLEG